MTKRTSKSKAKRMATAAINAAIQAASPRWPDRTPKSTGNAFDWRAQPSTIAKSFSAYENGKVGGKLRMQVGLARGEAFYLTATQKPFQTYSHAIPSVFKGRDQ